MNGYLNGYSRQHKCPDPKGPKPNCSYNMSEGCARSYQAEIGRGNIPPCVWNTIPQDIRAWLAHENPRLSEPPETQLKARKRLH